MGVKLFNCGELQSYFGIVQIIFYWMNQKTEIWLDSPFLKPANLFNPQIIRKDFENDLEQPIIKQQCNPQQILPSLFKYHTGPLSPWSSCVNPNPQNLSSHRRPMNLFPELSHEEMIEQKISLSDLEQQHFITPIRQNHRNEWQYQNQVNTTAKKIEPTKAIRKHRPKEKGLRQLSQRVFRIMQELQVASYKIVASRLLGQLQEGANREERQEQNIKRRVYDALNVLISLGVLTKEGNKISFKSGISWRTRISEKEKLIGDINEKILKSEAALKQKSLQLKLIQQKYKLISSLLNRNMKEKHQTQKVGFPYIGVICKDSPAEGSQLISKSKSALAQQLTVQSSLPIFLFGDIDSIKWMNESIKSQSQR